MARSAEITPDVARLVGRTCIGTSVQRAARSLSRAYDAAFRPLGISSWQFTLMMSLVVPEPPTVNELAARLSLDASTVTTNIKVLERRGLVAVELDDSDKRARRITLTDPGHALLVEALPRWEEAQRSSLGRLSDIDLDTVRKAMSMLAG